MSKELWSAEHYVVVMLMVSKATGCVNAGCFRHETPEFIFFLGLYIIVVALLPLPGVSRSLCTTCAKQGVNVVDHGFSIILWRRVGVRVYGF